MGKGVYLPVKAAFEQAKWFKDEAYFNLDYILSEKDRYFSYTNQIDNTSVTLNNFHRDVRKDIVFNFSLNESIFQLDGMLRVSNQIIFSDKNKKILYTNESKVLDLISKSLNNYIDKDTENMFLGISSPLKLKKAE